MNDTADRYLEAAVAQLAAVHAASRTAITDAVAAILATAERGGRVYVFGTGHSHIFAEELHYRAGGLALTVPILAGPLMLHEGAVASSAYERIPGMVAPILDRYRLGQGDVLIVASNSGVNAAPVEAAQIGRARGATVIALTSVAYSTAVAAGRPTLAGLADIVLDNGCPPGDAVVEVPGSALKIGPLSTVIGTALLNAIFAEVAARLAGGGDAPVYLSANMPGAAEVNRDLVARFRPGNPHL